MDSLLKRVDKIEDQLEPDRGPGLQWPNDDGTFTEVPGCRSLNDPQIALGIARGSAGQDDERPTDDDDRN